MIWLKEKNKFIGYVPILNKEYSIEEIYKMNDYCGHDGWSKLAILVMKIQGINCEYVNKLDGYSISNNNTLKDIKDTFDFECLDRAKTYKLDRYIKQIFEVFNDLTLYKIEEYNEEDFIKEMTDKLQSMKEYLSSNTLLKIDYELNLFNKEAKQTTNNLNNLFKLFAERGYIMYHNIFQNATQEIINKSQEERTPNEILLMKRNRK